MKTVFEGPQFLRVPKGPGIKKLENLRNKVPFVCILLELERFYISVILIFCNFNILGFL
jgi:hypothetical protein